MHTTGGGTNDAQRLHDYRRVLLLLLPGLGDALSCSPLVRSLRDHRPGWRLDALTMLAPVREYANELGVFEAVRHLPLLSMSPLGAAVSLCRRRDQRYDYVILPYPAGRWQYHAVAQLVKARDRVTHRYPSLGLRFLRAVMRTKAVALCGGSRVRENLNLLPLLGVSPGGEELGYLIPASWLAGGERSGIGIHAGTMVYKGNEARRWPLERFRELIARLPTSEPISIVSGPNEREEARYLLRSAPRGARLIEGTLREVALEISRCRLLIANDSGIAHLGSGLGVTTLILYGMTRPERALPPRNAVAVRPSTCPPCFDEYAPRFSCARSLDFRCIREDLEVAHVLRAVRDAFAAAQPQAPT